ncbi:MAG: Ldh family oxidoreductase [Candidatus Bathyarchaeia archaeon]
MKVLYADQLKPICLAILEAVRTPKDEAEVVADSLVKANLRGIDSHGVFRLVVYVNRVEHKTIIPGAPFTIIRETPSIALVSGGFGFGQVIGVKAMKLAVEKARKTGIGAVSVFDTNHFGMAAYYAMIALQNDMIGVVTCNTSPWVVPWGGRVPMLGTNPICVAIPSGQDIPIILDMATSAVARGKIERAAKEGKPIPEGWAVDQNGEPTTDPVAALKGALLPFGGPKGYGLSLVVDIISGALSGAACGKDVRSLYPEEEKSNLGQFYLAINVDAFIPVQDFKAKVNKVIHELKSRPSPAGYAEVLIPGEIEYRTEQKRLKEGIPLGHETWQILEKLCEKLKIDISE